MKKRKIVAISDSRSDYAYMKPVFQEIVGKKGLELHVVVTGMNLLPEYGSAWKLIKKDGFRIYKTHPHRSLFDDTGISTAIRFGYIMTDVAHYVQKIQPDIILLQGDRYEMLAGAIAGAYANIPIVHMSGGDRSGSIDDSIRNAITKFSHVHLVTCGESARNMQKMNEDPARVVTVGEPTLDVIRTLDTIPAKDLGKKFGFDPGRPLILMTQHAVASEVTDAGSHMRETLEALVEIGEQTLITSPNSDPGGQAMRSVMEEYHDVKNFIFLKPLTHEIYLNLMAISSVMVGNSSSGIIEAPSFRLPAVNIGTRQVNRVRACNVIDVGYDRKDIIAGIRKALDDTVFIQSLAACTSPYGDGHTSEKTADILSRMRLDPAIISKWIPISSIFME